MNRFPVEALVMAASVALVAAGVIWVRTATVKATYAYVQKEKDFRQLQHEIQAIRVRWLKVTSPRKLEGMARVLGLGPPRINQVLRYEPEKSASVASQ